MFRTGHTKKASKPLQHAAPEATHQQPHQEKSIMQTAIHLIQNLTALGLVVLTLILSVKR